MAMPGTQTLRFRRPVPVPVPKARHTGMLQDKIRRTAKAPWSPSLSVAFRIIILIRFCAAMYSNIQDCDEVFNFWEPLHYLDKNHAFQTWETSPLYAIRSWTYILLHLPFSRLPNLLPRLGKRQAFFSVRIVLAFVSSYTEATFYRTVANYVNDRVGRYMLFMSLLSPGMWNASIAFLPSSFSMYALCLAWSFSFQAPSQSTRSRTLGAVLCFAVGAVVGWPFSLLLAVPFVIEEVCVYGKDRVPPEAYSIWIVGRVRRLITCSVVAATIFIPVITIDSWAYGRLSIVPWNIIKYNVFGEAERGPHLYGTEPWYFYILNLLLNFNSMLFLALGSLPALLITYRYDYTRMGAIKHRRDESSPFTLVAVRLLPFYLWILVLSVQPHKEERFMYPAYPLIAFNAAITVFLVRGWAEAIYIKFTSPYAATQTSLFKYLTISILVTSMVLSLSRIVALNHYYHSPLEIAYHFEYVELPRLLNATGLLPPRPPLRKGDNPAYQNDYPVDLSPIKRFGLRICYGKEWHRFPGHYLIPDGVDVQFIKSEFNGLLPGKFEKSVGTEGLWKRERTRVIPSGLNDLNREEASNYVDPSTCDYLLDLDFPLHPVLSPWEPRHAIDNETWDRVQCLPFLDAAHSSQLTRILYFPIAEWDAHNSFGDYCLLRNKKRIGKIEASQW